MIDPRLDEVIATLLPGDGECPCAAALPGLARQVAAEVDVAPLLAALPAAFARGDETAVRAVEAAHPAAFERLVAAAYLAYYTHEVVRAVLERVAGYEARPPQPLGYELPPFDEALLAVQKRRAPFWRKA